MIWLVSLNLYLVALPQNQQLGGRWLQPKYLGLVCTAFLVIVLVKTNWFYVRPSMVTLDQYLNSGVKLEFLQQIEPESDVCLLSKHMGEDIQTAPLVALKYAYLYSSYFHPEIDYDYSVQAALNPEFCGTRAVVPSNINLDNWPELSRKELNQEILNNNKKSWI